MSARERTVERPPAPRPAPRGKESPDPSSVSLSIREAVGAAGQPLDRATRDLLEPRFGFDFSRVRVHTGRAAVQSATQVNACAYTVGSHIVFGSGQFAPGTPHGSRLLAHELSHVVQQRGVSEHALPQAQIGPENDAWERAAELQTERASGALSPIHPGPALTRPRVQRSSFGSFMSDLFSLSPGPFKAIARLFGSEKYSDDELQRYLKKITTDKKIEDRYDSDNKARAIVKRWMAKQPGFDLKPPIKILLIREMQSGYTSGDDERAILTILHNSASELDQIFGAGAIDPKNLDSDFSGANGKELRAFYDQYFEGGAKAVLAGSKELTRHVPAAYSWAEFKKVIDQRFRRIEAAVKSAPEKEQGHAARDTAQASADEINAEMNHYSPKERDQALQDVAAERVRQDDDRRSVDFQALDKKLDAASKALLEHRSQVLRGCSFLLDLILQNAAEGVAASAPAGAKAFEKTTTPITAAQKTAAKQALKAPTKTPGAKFERQLPGEKDTYEDQIRARAPKMIDEIYDFTAKRRTEKEHGDPSKLHQPDEIQEIANASRDETDKVFGNFKKASAFTPDKFDAAGKLTKKGNIHDLWASEEAKRKKNPAYEGEAALDMMFYLLQNDHSKGPETIQTIEFRHNATPKLDKNNTPLNDEAKVIAEVGNKYAKSESKRLFEINRAWPAFNVTGDVSIQFLKDPDSKKDRQVLWDSFFTLIHEYLHTLKNSNYDTFANSLGGESSNEGGTLIEGVDSLLTETVWTHVKPRAALPEIRDRVEPQAVKAAEPFDASLLPQMPAHRYPTYANAVKLVSVVGIRNLYDAYFYGNVKAIGG